MNRAEHKVRVDELIAAANRALILLEMMERGEGETAVLVRAAIAGMEDTQRNGKPHSKGPGLLGR